MVSRRAYLAGVSVAAVGAGCLGPSTTERLAADHDVAGEMRGVSYVERSVTVSTGDSVAWYNDDGDTPHTITAYGDRIPEAAAYFASGGADSESAARQRYDEYFNAGLADEDRGIKQNGDVEPGGWYAHTFETPGEYPYFCIPHEHAGMKGTVVVRE